MGGLNDPADHAWAEEVADKDQPNGYAGLDGQCKFVNPGGLKLVGLGSEEDACSRTMFDFFEPEDVAEFRDEILARVMKGENWEGELNFRDFSGAEKEIIRFW